MRFFTKFTPAKGVFYFSTTVLVLCWTVVVILQPWIDLECDLPPTGRSFGNAAYVDDPCRQLRTHQLLWLTAEECDFGRRILFSIVMGGIIGWERRQADRPAGIRTMALVSLGACLFTICSIFAFLSGPMTWDSSRVSAAIPSGVGFLGAGLIYKDVMQISENGETHNVPQVHGLTTAASLWLSAAVGVAAGGGMYFVACFCVVLMILLLRFGPRIMDDDDNSDGEFSPHRSSPPGVYGSAIQTTVDVTKEKEETTELTPLSNSQHRTSFHRSRSTQSAPMLT